MASKINYYLGITLILVLGFGQLLKFNYHLVPIYLHDIIIALIILINVKALFRQIPRSFYFLLIGLIIGWLRAIDLFPINLLEIPPLYTLRLILYLALYQIITNSKLIIPIKYFWLSGIVTAIIGLTQYFLMPDMRWAQYLGWDDHLGRLVMPHFDPSFTGIMLALTLLISVNKYNWRQWLKLPILFLSILLTYSRSVWLSLISTLIMMLPRKNLLIVLVISFVGIAMLPVRFGEGTNLSRAFSITSRFNHDLAIMRSLGSDLLIGRGLNTFALETKSAYGFTNNAKGPNNSYLYILATMGVLGLIGWILLLKDMYQSSPYPATHIFILIASLFNNVLFYPFVLIWLFMLPCLRVPNEA